MKGIILAGGKGTRLEPLTSVFNKHLLPVYDKPMIYYPLSVLMLSGIRDILIIDNENDLNFYKKLLGDGTDFGVNISFELQKKAEGIAQSFIIGKKFIGSDNVCLILGNNLLIFIISGIKPISNIRSASSIISNFLSWTRGRYFSFFTFELSWIYLIASNTLSVYC